MARYPCDGAVETTTYRVRRGVSTTGLTSSKWITDNTQHGTAGLRYRLPGGRNSRMKAVRLEDGSTVRLKLDRTAIREDAPDFQL